MRTDSQILARSNEVIPELDLTIDGKYTTPEEYRARIDDISSPTERLLILVKDTFAYGQLDRIHEAYFIRRITLTTGLIGFIWGGWFDSADLHDGYRRKYNASAFSDVHRARRHYFDNILTVLMSKGLPYGIKLSLMSTSAAFVGVGSVTCRNKLYLPDFLVGGAALGGLSKLWLGTKGVVFGMGVGAIGGLIGFGYGKVSEYLMGCSVAEFRYRNHKDWLMARDQTRRGLIMFGQQEFQEFVDKDTDL